VTNAREVQHVR